ncbi:HI0074 family nucleotidyltransferase substrate-binding subunit [Trichlorobacter ammonificans]|uniref:Nucleotidyltransferase n=1 Tax=Trichlorobacter ammonificans TaxID=2916410 RepID=A0ABM9D7X6_9BACT|nr:HI0074 family nucleotidyltransferase substrate-binding subunit [Trichlorobacter ammonificans]CAH2030838.1 Nucleotidyltransferase [Trichlorobacter ammonificans]
MSLDFSSLANAIGQLEKSISFATSDMAKQNDELFEQLRNSVIQCFEFTYELSWKMLKRYLEETAASPDEIDTSAFQNLIRMGNEQGLLRSDWSRWKVYRQARTISSHAYDADKAGKVYEIAPDFLEEARYLHAQLMKKDQTL